MMGCFLRAAIIRSKREMQSDISDFAPANEWQVQQ